MNKAFLEQATKFDELQKGIIASKFSNSQEVLLSEEQVEFEEKVRKGEVEVITKEDVAEMHNDQYWLRADIEAMQEKMDALIQKGEDDYMEETEWNEIQTGKSEIETLVSKAIAIEKGGVTRYLEIFVKPTKEETTDGKEEV